MQTPIKPQLDKRLHFPFSERSLAASTDHPPTHNCTLIIHIEPEGITSLGRKKLFNNSGIPQHEIERIAQCIFPDILAYYESAEGRREFREWQAQREAEPAEGKEGKSKQVTKQGAVSLAALFLVLQASTLTHLGGKRAADCNAFLSLLGLKEYNNLRMLKNGLLNA